VSLPSSPHLSLLGDVSHEVVDRHDLAVFAALGYSLPIDDAPLIAFFRSPGPTFDFARTGTNIAKMLAGSVALLAVANCEPSDGLFATATTDTAGGSPLASAFGTQQSIRHWLPRLTTETTDTFFTYH